MAVARFLHRFRLRCGADGRPLRDRAAQDLRRDRGPEGRHARRAGGGARRAARPERRGQVDAGEDRVRVGPPDRRGGDGVRRARRVDRRRRRNRLPGRAVPLPRLVLGRRAARAAPAARRLGRRRGRAGAAARARRPRPEAARRVGTMSKGMQQRLGIAQAMVGSPRLLLLDEPTSALDPAGRRTVRALLERLRGEGVAVLLNSHLLSEVELVCDRVAIIDRGELVAAGTPAELSSAGGVEIETAAGVRRWPDATRDDVAADRRRPRRRRRAGLRGPPPAFVARRCVPRGGQRQTRIRCQALIAPGGCGDLGPGGVRPAGGRCAGGCSRSWPCSPPRSSSSTRWGSGRPSRISDDLGGGFIGVDPEASSARRCSAWRCSGCSSSAPCWRSS